MTVSDEHTLYGGPDPYDLLDGHKSIGQMYVQRLNSYGQQVLFVDASTGEQLTAVRLRDRGIRIAECLRHYGIRSGDVIGICAENRAEFVDVMLGVQMLGACLTPMNPQYTAAELEHAVRLSQPRLVFGDDGVVADRLATVVRRCAFVERLIVFDAPKKLTASAPATPATVLKDDEKRQRFGAFVNDRRVRQVGFGSVYKCADQNMDDTLGLLLYSSGTTGLPKGVELTQRNSLLAIHRFQLLQLTDDDKAAKAIQLCIIPFCHTFGCHVLMISLLSGQQIVSMPGFEANGFLGAIEKYRCTCLYVAPPLMVFLAKSELVDRYDLSSVRTIQSGAAPLTGDLVQAVADRWRTVPPNVRQGYGMTEGTVVFTAQSMRCHQSGSVGELVVGMYGRVVRPEDGRVLAVGEVGELQFRGNLMRGYVGDAAASAEAIGADGWMRTGDIGYYTEEGEWYVVDRLKELIKCKGFQVAPAELEGLLLQMDRIADAGVVGVADDRAGELPLAFVVRKPEAMELTEMEVMDFVRERVSDAKRLRGGVRFVNEIPKSPSGKILRRTLREWAKSKTVVVPKAKL